MNPHQFKELVANKYGVEPSYWAPEAAVARFRQTPQCSNNAYQTALMVLCENATAFRNRLRGNITDEWLSAKTFGPILGQMILALEDAAQLQEYYPADERFEMADWQTELLTLPKTF